MHAPDYSLYLVTDDPGAYPKGLLEGVGAAIDGGATVVQYRPTVGAKRQLYESALALAQLLRQRHVPLVINDHLDLALAVDADGLHLGQNDLPIEVARRILGPRKLLGLSITHASQLEQVPPGIVDYLGVGPVFVTATKVDAAPAMGLARLAGIVERTELPVVAIGGISPANAPGVFAAGAVGVAVVSALSRCSDPASIARQFLAGRASSKH